MRQIQCVLPGHIILHDVAEPRIRSGLVKLKIERVGICGTDLHAFNGNQAYFEYPRVLGHELVATVIADRDKGEFAEGDLVVIIPYINCEECTACQAGKTNCCENLEVFGVHTDGGMRDFVNIPGRLLMRASGLVPDQAVLVEPLAIGAHAIRRGGVKAGDHVLVMGCGPIGIGIVQLCKYVGATVIALDMNNHRLSMTKNHFHADYTFNSQEYSADQIKGLLDGKLADTVFDATGNKLAIESGTDYMRHGGNLVLVGLFKGDLQFNHPKIHAKESSILCSRNATRQDFEFVLRVLSEGRFNEEQYISQKVPFEEIPESMADWTSPESQNIKVIASLT